MKGTREVIHDRYEVNLDERMRMRMKCTREVIDDEGPDSPRSEYHLPRDLALVIIPRSGLLAIFLDDICFIRVRSNHGPRSESFMRIVTHEEDP